MAAMVALRALTMRLRFFFVTVRLAIRNALRRKGEGLLVVLGSLLGTAIITSSFVVGDTLHATIRDQARTRLGPIDEVALVHRASDLPAARQRITSRPLPGTDGLLTETTAAAAIATIPERTAGARRAVPDAFVQEVDFDAARAFGSNPADTGFADAGPTPSGGDAVIGADLAEELQVGAGDLVQVFAYGRTLAVRVRNVVPRLGVAGFHPGFENRAPNIFVAPGTLAALASGASAGSVVPEGRVLISNRGGVYDSTAPTDALLLELQIRTAGLGGMEFIGEKQATLEFADRQGASFTRLFALIGSFTVVAGVLLLVNLFVMLAEERKSELGTLRALGFGRRHLVRVFGVEGTLYSLAAGVLGAVAGIGVGRVVVAVTEGIFAEGRRGITSLEFAVRPGSVAIGFAIGLAIALATVWATSVRISRLNIVRAIRDVPEPRRALRPARRIALDAAAVVAGGVVFAVGVITTQPIAALVGPAIAAWCAVPLLTTVVPRRLAVSLPNAVLLVYVASAFSLLPSVFDGSDLPVFFVQGVVLVLAGVVLAVANDDVFHRVSSALAATGGGLSVKLGLATPLAKRVRTALLLAMYALVVFVLVFMAVFAAVFRREAPRLASQTSAGFDLRVDSNLANPVTAAQLEGQDGVAAAVPLYRAEAQFRRDERTSAVTQVLTGFDEMLLSRGVPKLSSRLSQYPDDAAAWRAVLADPGLVIAPAGFLSPGVGPPRETVRPGDRLTLVDPATGRRHPLTVAGVDGPLDPAQNGAMVAASTLPTLVDRTSASRFYVAVDPGASPTDVAARLQADLLTNGVKADTFRSLVDDRLRPQAQFIALLQGFLSLGLVIGIAGLGVVMVRAVRERRREIGMLRAMGVSSAVVRRSFVVEASFVAVQGIVIGGALGLLTGFSVLGNSTVIGGEELAFTVPWPALALLAVVALGGSLVAVAVPATQASRIAPAAALRIAD